jgi:hypothetical protein
LIKIIYTSLVLLLAPGAVFAGVLIAQKPAVAIYSAADKASSVLVTLNAGDTVTYSERSGMYWQVLTKDGKPGFVSVLAVKVKPEEKVGLNDAMREAVKNGRSQSTADGGRTRSAVMGVRGLDDTSETGMAGSLRPNLHAVYAMEDMNLAPELVEDQAKLVMDEIELKVQAEK